MRQAMPKLSVETRERPSSGAAGTRERQRRAEALRRQRADERVQKLAGAGELAYLRAQLRVA